MLSYTNGSHEGFVEFCVIEVFKFWVILRWMKEGWKSLSFGCPGIPIYYPKMSNQLSLGMPPSGIPAFFQQLSVFYSRLYFYSSHDMCFAWSVLYDMSLCLLVYQNHPCCTHLLGETHMIRNLLEYSMCFTYIF